MLLDELEQQLAIELVRVHALQRLRAFSLPVLDQVSEELAAPSYSAFEECEAQLGEAPRHAAEEKSLRYRGRARGSEGTFPRRRDAALPRAALRIPRRRSRLGLPALRRPDRALGAKRRAGVEAHGPGQARSQAVAQAHRGAWLRRHRRGVEVTRRLARSGRQKADRSSHRARRL